MPQQEMEATRVHPRRPPAHQSVSLVHSPRSKRARTHSPAPSPIAEFLDPIERRMSSPSSLRPHVGKDDSNESSNAERWFENNNNDISAHNGSYTDNDPPFFLRNSSSEETPLDQAYRPPATMFNEPPATAFTSRADLLIHGDESSTDDYRGVIDDLTIENKKLKRKLKTYQKFHDSKLKDDKLFEVRFHGLPSTKKRELEQVLQKFALSLNPETTKRLPGLHDRMVPSLAPRRSAASSNHFNDSAYASASASGQGSAQSHTPMKRNKFNQSASSRHQNIQSYLHEIPEGLMPRAPVPMTEKGKKKLVVRLLEQLFAGKLATSGGTGQQPLQQQEVSDMAAKNDRTAQNQQPGAQGGREAHFMGDETEDPLDMTSGSIPRLGLQTSDDEHDLKRPDQIEMAPDQRPTKPLDLDPARAQVPAENMRYIRHLGFSPPGAGMEAPEDGHGWIYLNVLSNMAQLHTINVTGDFVKDALTQHSRKIEVSEDGRKVRWKGGKSPTQNSSDGSTPLLVTGGSGDSADSMSPRTRLKQSLTGSSSSDQRTPHTGLPAKQNKLAYTPLFYHRSSSDDSSSEDESEEIVDSPPGLPGPNSSGINTSANFTGPSRKHKSQDTGPIIFYSNARFCTDLSGDDRTEEAMLLNPILYHNISTHPIGVPPPKDLDDSPSDERGLLNEAVDLPEPMDFDDNPIPQSLELNFPLGSPLTQQHGNDRKTYAFEASGVGGVCPADNFAINVHSVHARIDNACAPETVRHETPKYYSSRIADIFKESGAHGRMSRSALHKEILSLNHEDLPASELPAASCFMSIEDSSNEDDDSDMDDSFSLSGESPDAPHPAAAPQPINVDFASSDAGDDEHDESDDGSLDLLAFARKIDPAAVRAHEREYEAHMADRLVDDIPAGSSAATAEGGSAFGSPNFDRIREQQAKAKQMVDHANAAANWSNPSGTKRARVGDSTFGQ